MHSAGMEERDVVMNVVQGDAHTIVPRGGNDSRSERTGSK